MITGLNLLIICNENQDANKVCDGLAHAGYDASLKWVNTERTFRDALSEQDYDLVLCDDQTDHVDTVTARSLIAEIGHDVPFIVISNTMTPEAQKIASQMKAGVDDFVEWGKPDHLIPAVERALRASETRRLNRLAEQEMHFRANYDALTTLPNRTLMYDRLSQAMKSARRNDSGVLFMYLDLDHFKDVNDTMGHLAGDQLLRKVADRITAVLRDSDTAARIGGDEFAIILPEARDTGIAEKIAGNLLKTLSAPFVLDSQKAFISVSIGITQFPKDGDRPSDLMKQADQAMYAAKRFGRNAYKVYADLEDQTKSNAGYLHAASSIPFKEARPGQSMKQLGIAIAAALAVIVVTSVWMTSMNTKDSLIMAIDQNMEILSDFATASGEDEDEN